MEILKKTISAFLALAMVLTMLPMPTANAAEEETLGETAPAETLPALETLSIPDKTAFAVETEVVSETTVATEADAETTVSEETSPESTEAESEETEATETVPKTSAAEEAEPDQLCGENLTWVLDEDAGVLIISGTGAMEDFGRAEDVPWYDLKDKITNVILPDGLTSIADHAFRSCTGLTQIEIPDSVTNIGNSAFYYCANLADVTIPGSVNTVESFAFAGCNKLTSAVICEGVAYIGNAAFAWCDDLKTVSIPDSVTHIGSAAFQNCEALEAVQLPQDVMEITYSVFSGCRSLTEVTLPESLKSIGYEAFSDCKSLTHIEIPETVTAIDISVFANCSNLENVKLPDSLTTISEYLFVNCTGLKSVDIPGSVTNIAYRAFMNSGLEEIILPEKLETIEYHAFDSCASLEKVTIPDSVMSISYSSFENCTGLKNINLPDTLSAIDAYGFRNCTSLSSISLPEKLDFISIGAFEDCTALKEIRFTGSYPSIFDEHAFLGVTATVYYPSNEATWTEERRGDYSGTLTWVPYKPNIPTEGTCGEKLTWSFDETSGILTISGTGDMTEYAKAGDAPWYGHRNEITRVIIPEGVTSIGSYAFAECNIWEVRTSSKMNETWKFPDSVETIGDHAFDGCAFVNLFLPKNLMAIGTSAFANCKELAGFTVPKNVVYIGNDAFANCSGIGNIKIVSENVEIGNGAFSGCSFLYQFILETAEFGKAVFDGCENLREITFKDDASTFKADTFKGVNTRIYYPLYRAGWTSSLLKDYGGSIQWLGYEENSGYCGENVTWGFNEKKGTLIISGTGDLYENYLEKYLPWEDYTLWIQSVVIEEGVTGNLQASFFGCENLKTVQIPEGITIIGHSAFEGCKKLETITIPKSVTVIGWDVFAGCESLDEITFLGNAPEFHEESFCDVTATVNYPANNSSWSAEKRQNYGGQITWKGYQDENLISGTCGETVYWELNPSTGTLRIWGEGEMADYKFLNRAPWYEHRQKIQAAVIEKGVTSVGNYAFEACNYLASAILPDSLEEIGDSSFEDCTALKEIIIPESVNAIWSSAFYNCDGLVSVTIPENVTKFGNSIFSNCGNLSSVKLPENMTRLPQNLFINCVSLIKVDIPDSVTTIENAAFMGCDSLNSITIPESVITIGRSAFDSSGLFSVVIPKSVTGFGESAFADSDLHTVIFQGDSCKIGNAAFADVTADVYCPASWTEDMWKDYGGKLTWHVLEEFCFLLQPEDCVTAVGAEAVFTSRASEDAQYQWSWSADGKSWTPIEGANGMELKLTAKTQHTGQLFRCEATNGEGKTAISTAASLSLYSQVETDSSFDVNIGKGGDIAYFAFVPEYTDFYTFRTDYEEEITTLVIRDGGKKIMAADSGKADWMNGVYHTAEAVSKLDAGQTYILSAKYDSDSETGTFRVELKTSHDDSKAVIIPAACTEDGSKVFSCALCGEEIKEVLPAAGHTMGEGKVVEEPNCYKQGVIVYTCTVCNEEVAEWLPIEHTYEDGNETCSICGYGYYYMQELQLGHNNSGMIWYWYVPEHTHSYSIRSGSPAVSCGVYTEEDTLLAEAKSDGTGFELECVLEAGRKYIIRLESLYEGAIDHYATIDFAMNHNYETVVPDSCDSKIVHTCTDCGEIFREEMEHTWNDGKILVEATCTSDGFAAYTCTVCGTMETRRMSNGHIWQRTTLKDTCETEYICKVCKEKKVEGGHVFATYGDDVGICSRCGKTRYVEGTCGDLKWVLENRKLVISGNGAIPDYKMSRDTPWYEYYNEILEVEVKENITRIGDYSLALSRVTSIQLPESLEEIGSNAFQYTEITKLDIPIGVHTIEDNAFVYCYELNSIWVDKRNQHYSNDAAGNLYTKDKTTLVALSAAISGTFTVPKYVETVAPGAFDTGNSYVSMIIFHENFKKIPDNMLYSYGKRTLQFTGDAPEIAESAFVNFYGTIVYPAENNTWNTVIHTSYGGSPEWIAWKSGIIDSGDFGTNLHWELSSDSVLTISGYGDIPNFDYSYGIEEEQGHPWAIYKDLITNVVIEKGVTGIGNQAFKEHGSLVAVTIPDGVANIGNNAFEKCKFLKAVSIPKSVKKFGWSIFLDCENLVSAELPEGMTVIPDTMFGRCYALSEVNIPSTVTAIEPAAFSNCYSLEKVTLPKGLTYIEYWAFRGTAVKEIVIPDKVTYLGKSAFASCEELTSVKLPNSLQSISANAFAYCSKLPSIDIPDTVKFIGWGAFGYCTSLTDLTIPDGIAYLGGTFMGCSNLKSVNIPDSVKTLAYFAFYDCSSLTALDMPEKLEIIEDEVFSGSGIQEIIIPENVETLEDRIFRNSALEKITFTGDVPEMVPYECSNNWENGTFVGAEADAYYPAANATWTKKVLSANYGGSINWIPYGDDVPVTGMCGEHLTWTYDPETDTLTIAGYGDMYDYSPDHPAPWTPYRENIRRIILPDGLTSIGDYAFYGCDHVEKILISKTISAIGAGAFYGCAALKEITFAGNAPEQVGMAAFSGVTAMVVYPENNATWNAEVMQNYGGSLTWKPAEGNDHQLGDVNHDGKINAKDATLILQKSVGVLKDSAKFCEDCAEVSGDGKLNAKDSTLILQFSVGLRDSFPAKK